MIDDKQTCDVCVEETRGKHSHKKSMKAVKKKPGKKKN